MMGHPARPPLPAPFDVICAVVSNPNAPDLSLRQLAVLALLGQAGPVGCQHRDIVAALDINKPAITRSTDRLVELGFVTRSIGRQDRRDTISHITASGRAYLALLTPATPALRSAA